MQLKDIPNILTVGRMILIVPIALLLANRLFAEALFLFFIAGISDGLDGFLAKRYGWRSDLGAILDPLADKFLLIVMYLVCWQINILPWWLVTAVIFRDILIIGGAFLYYQKIQKITMSPSIVSKINTFIQISLILVLLINNVFQLFDESWLSFMFFVVLTTTAMSGADYAWTWGLKFLHQIKGGKF